MVGPVAAWLCLVRRRALLRVITAAATVVLLFGLMAFVGGVAAIGRYERRVRCRLCANQTPQSITTPIRELATAWKSATAASCYTS